MVASRFRVLPHPIQKGLHNINGHSLYIEIYGPSDAPAVILLHHGLGSTRSWDAQISPLAKEFRLIVYDRWGYGKSDPRSNFSIPYFKEDLQDLLVLMDYFEVTQASLVGHSDGGTLALYFSAQYPQRVQNMIVVAAHIYIEPKMETGVENLHYSYEIDKRIQKGLRRLHKNQAQTVFYNWYNGWADIDKRNWDIRPIINNITAPTLVIQGTEDEYATSQHAEDVADSLPYAKLWLAKGAKHMLPIEEPELFNQKVINYLRGNIKMPIQKGLN